jgi:RNA polymerase II subunit A C-terminal domain phosphatase SSU72
VNFVQQNFKNTTTVSPMSDMRIALVCASNQNRSMETHALLVKKGYQNVSSFGTNSKVRLPGPAPDQPLIYEFGTSYAAMIEDLRSRDEELYVCESHCTPVSCSLLDIHRKAYYRC